MARLDGLLGRTYDRRLYNCAHFASEAWKLETGEDLLHLLTPLMDGADRAAARALGLLFRSVEGPRAAGVRALVVMRRPRSASHVGVYLRGRVLHLHENGPEFLPPDVATRGFTDATYYIRRA